MIEVKRNDKYAISFYFKVKDKSDTNNMVDAFKQALNLKTVVESCTLKVERNVFTKRRRSDYEEMRLFVKLGSNHIHTNNNRFTLELDEDDLEYGIDLLEEYIKLGHFRVAEFAKVTKPGSKWSDDIYFVEEIDR